MKFAEFFAGVGGFRLGMERAGMQCAFACEIDPAPCSIYRTHWNDGTLYEGSIEDVTPEMIKGVDVICGGFPCQDVSVAGRRRGLKGERSGLFWELIRLISTVRPRFIFIENVPGLPHVDDGRGMHAVIAALDELGYGVAWQGGADKRHGAIQGARQCRDGQRDRMDCQAHDEGGDNMTEIARIELPYHLKSPLNQRGHWGKKSKTAKVHRRAAWFHMMAALFGKSPPLPLTVRLTRVAPRRLDDDNLRGAFKALRDGVADALTGDGVYKKGNDDEGAGITWEYAQEKGKSAAVIEVVRRE